MPRESIAAGLLVALDRDDDIALASLLGPDVRLAVDTDAPTSPSGPSSGALRGRAGVMRELRALQERHPDAALETVEVNGCPGLALRDRDGSIVGILAIDARAGSTGTEKAEGEKITDLWLTMAPAKLAHWNRRHPLS